MAFGGRLEAFFTVPSSTTVTATNSGGSNTSVSLTAGSYTPTSFLSHLVSQLNTSRPANYPATAGALNTAVGYGTWSGAWLCDESSGNLSAAFGGVTLTASGTPTYGTAGPISSADDAVGLDSTDAFSGGDVLDVTDVDDLAVLLVWKLNTTPADGYNNITSKGTDPRWDLYTLTSGGVTTASLYAVNGASSAQVDHVVASGVWVATIATINRATGKLRCGSVRLDTEAVTVSAEGTMPAVTLTNAGNLLLGRNSSDAPDMSVAYYAIAVGSGAATGLSANLSTALSNFASYINNASWTGSLSTGQAGTGLVTLSGSGSWTVAWTTAEAGTVLGYAASATLAAPTGTTNARGLWLPDCPLSIAGHPSTAPVHSDLRLVESPTGAVIGHKSNSKYRHTGLVYSHVPLARYREASATYDYASWEAFLDDTQYGDGHTWFSPASKVAIYWDNAGTDAAVGADASVTGWYLRGVESTSAGLSVEGYTGLYRIEIPEITSAG